MQDTTTTPLFSAELTPHRALSRRGRWLVVVGAAILGALPAMIAVALGAWPVVICVAGAVLAIALALNYSHNDGKRCQRVQIWSDRLEITRVGPRGHARSRKFLPTAVRLVVDRDFDERTIALHIRSAHDELEIGEFLSPDEKSSFAMAFGTALRKARIRAVKTGS
ncbi:DUF2244 domain-containing protein [Devosia rhodophyticola]|uniref:DUF2244 domain-containing protein n=1 Tax=Devosia rhodophyticola TaxID=3026423 RepID=A0ABY7Z2D1_9HYPH|nr:DUF2244 domain-containing protein [Devosia rhodophyticola]WDR07360.1 DUF2244 domain-containing protein [Devosia rhodophyticola]